MGTRVDPRFRRVPAGRQIHGELRTEFLRPHETPAIGKRAGRLKLERRWKAKRESEAKGG